MWKCGSVEVWKCESVGNVKLGTLTFCIALNLHLKPKIKLKLFYVKELFQNSHCSF